MVSPDFPDLRIYGVSAFTNTHRCHAPSERGDREHYSPEAIQFLEGMGAVATTTADLYRLWMAHRRGEAEGPGVTGELAQTKGLWEYP